MKPQPPKRALQFLRWFCRRDYLEEIEGDLFELFEQDVERSPRRARRRFTWQVLRHLRPDFIRSMTVFNHLDMYKHYFKIAWRSMLRQKLYSGINIGGLAIGLSCFILIMLYIQHELSYDQFLSNADQIHRVYQRQAGNEYLGSDYFALTPAGLANALREEVPEIKQATTIVPRPGLLISEEQSFYEEGLLADARFFEVFPFAFRQGTPTTALQQPESLVLTESLARKIFGRQNPIGQTLQYQNDRSFTVTGVVEDPPTNSSIKFSYVLTIQSDGQYQENVKDEQWNNNSFHTFLTVDEQVDLGQLEGKVTTVFNQHDGKGPEYPFEDTYTVQPLSKMHLTNHINFDIGVKGNARYISLFTIIAILVLILASVNYMNLAIARSIKRAQEVGLRKVVGARRGQLIGQFIGESVLIAFLALGVALGIAYFLSPLFSHLLDRPIALDFVSNWYLLPGLLTLVLVVGVISGSYPALFMSALRPSTVLKGKANGRFAGSRVQKGLIIGQYATSIVLIICSMVIYRQFQFIQQKELGYEREHIVSMRVRDFGLRQHREQLKDALLKNPQVVSCTFSMGLPTNIDSSTIINDDEGSSNEDDLAIYEARGDEDFLDLFGIALVAGRNFSSDIQSDVQEAYIINETAAAAMGWTPEEAIGKQITHMGTETIIGVVRDFHMYSMHMAIEPLMIHNQAEFFNHISVKIRPENIAGTLADLQATMKMFSPFPADFQFLDDKFNTLYESDLRLGQMFGFFTVLSILIASLGLFGLAAFVARQRNKEVSIRKVLGASVQSIVQLLSKDFLGLVLVGFLLAVPLAWYAMDRWLQDFAYRVELEWWVFALAGIAAIVLAFLTVGSQSLKAAFANPASALKSE